MTLTKIKPQNPKTPKPHLFMKSGILVNDNVDHTLFNNFLLSNAAFAMSFFERSFISSNSGFLQKQVNNV